MQKCVAIRGERDMTQYSEVRAAESFFNGLDISYIPYSKDSVFKPFWLWLVTTKLTDQ